MKLKISILFLFVSQLFFGQIPAGYYNAATGTGYTLKTQLRNIIVHTGLSYDALYTTYQTSDLDNFSGAGFENDNTIYDYYSENPNGTDTYNYSNTSTNQCGNYDSERDCFNREHIVPQSVYNEDMPMVSDAHQVPPTDGYVNNRRSNLPHGIVSGTASWTSENGSKLGSSAISGYSGNIFEPLDAFKGDIARMYLYFAVRYENTVDNYTYPMFNGTSNQVFTTPFLNMLLAWHAADPVSQREINRNNAIYARQGNRNPFIDNPAYAQLIWNPTPDTVAPSAPTNLTGIATSNSVNLNWTPSTDNVGVVSYQVYVNNVLTTTVATNSANVAGLTPSTSYTFYIIALDAANNASSLSNSFIIMTNAGGGTINASELFFSEYVEGSSNNKALEIANFTGATVNLSIYTLKKQSNGAGAWGTALALTGNLNDDSTFVVVNSSIAVGCYMASIANISANVDAVTFNGNDPVGLFKNDVLIDIIGTFNAGSGNFGDNQTLRRKSSITAPNTTFDKALEWDQLAVDTCSDLNSHSFLPLSTNSNLKFTFNVYPNPSNGSFTINWDNNVKTTVTIYSILGKIVLEKNSNSDNSINIENLQKGIYLLKLNQDNQSITKKVIVN